MKLKKTESDKEGTGRIEAFSDAVFAIAITLLVLDIHVPVVKEEESLIQAVFINWETHLAFLIGFFTLLVCWINHHYMFEIICKSNGMLLLLNGFKLLVVTFTPYATALLSRYIGTSQQKTAISIYAFNFFLMGTAMTCLWVYAQQKGFTISESQQEIKASTRLYIFASVLSGTIFLFSFISTWICLVLFVLMFLIFVFPKSMIMYLVQRTNKKLQQQEHLRHLHQDTI